MTVKVKLYERPKLRQPVVICGLPGSGYVAKLAVDHLATELKAKLFGEVYSYSFPPQVTIKDDGSVDLIKNELYYWQSGENGSDLIIYTGDSQPVSPESEYEISDKVTEIFRTLGARSLFALAAFITGAFVEIPRVFATATELEFLEMLKKEGVQVMNEGAITGMNGLLVGFAKVKEIRGACLLGETSGYMADPKAAQSVLEVLARILSIKVDMGALEKRAAEMRALAKSVMEMQGRMGPGGPKQRSSPENLGYIS